jgi:hypothetical protein
MGGCAEPQCGQWLAADAGAARWFAGGTPVAFEAAFGWGWLAGLLEDYGFEAHLVHPLRCKAIASARLKNDKMDAAILAQLLRADLLPEAWIAPPTGLLACRKGVAKPTYPATGPLPFLPRSQGCDGAPPIAPKPSATSPPVTRSLPAVHGRATWVSVASLRPRVGPVRRIRPPAGRG